MSDVKMFGMTIPQLFQKLLLKENTPYVITPAYSILTALVRAHLLWLNGAVLHGRDVVEYVDEKGVTQYRKVAATAPTYYAWGEKTKFTLFGETAQSIRVAYKMIDTETLLLENGEKVWSKETSREAWSRDMATNSKNFSALPITIRPHQTWGRCHLFAAIKRDELSFSGIAKDEKEAIITILTEQLTTRLKKQEKEASW
jgi:hypothetical protein